MNRWSTFLRECVYYPCSGLDGTPVKLLSSRFRHFFYCDYSINRQVFENKVKKPGFRGYRLIGSEEVKPTDVFDISWEGFRQDHNNTISRLNFDWSNPFIAFCTFEREAGLTDSHGPETFELMFACAEAIATLISAFSAHRLSPKCLVHICSGIGFGGNFSNYPRLLENALRSNNAGLPQFILHDRMGVDHGGDHLRLIEEYREVQTWGYPDSGYLRLVERVNDSEQQVHADVPAARSRRLT